MIGLLISVIRAKMNNEDSLLIMTKKLLTYLIITLFTIGGFACTPPEQEQVQQQQRQQQLQTQFTETSPEFNQQLIHLLDIYFELKNALVETNQENTATAAEMLDEYIENMDASGLSPEIQTVWESYSHTIAGESSKIKSDQDIEQQRFYFETLSETMITLVKTFRPASYTIYHQSCPMVRDGTADWLSREEQIANPYHGDRMMRCGEVIERI